MKSRLSTIPISAKPWRPAALTLAVAIAFYLFAGNAIELANLRWLDSSLHWRKALRLTEPLAEEIRIVELDSQDLSEIGSEGEYTVVADTIRQLARHGVKVIVLDVLYSRGDAAQQQLIRDAIVEVGENYPVQIILPGVLYPESTPPRIQQSLELADGADSQLGVINMEVDADRIWRHYTHLHRFGDEFYPSLALAAYLAASSSHNEPVDGERPRLLNLRDSYFSNRVDADHGRGRWIWNLRDFRQLLDSSSDPSGSSFRGAVVFFGYGNGLDEKATCMGPQEPGVILHATALSDLLEERELRRATLWQDLLMMALIAALAIGLFQINRQRWLLTWGLVGFVAIIAFGFLLVVLADFVSGVVPGASLWLLLIFVEVGRRHSVELVERIRVDTTLAYYFSDSVLKSVRETPGSTEPRDAELSVLITDIRNFTTLCEKLPPKEMFHLLSEAFGVQTNSALAHDGSLQHFWGDQFLAYWGAPEPQADAADRTLNAACLLSTRLDEFQRSLPDEIGELFGFGVALHYGKGLVGNMGSGRYLDYCVFGDVVNVSARIEALTKCYGIRMLASRSFYDALQNPPASRLLDEVYVAGKQDTTVDLLELQPDSGEMPYAERFAELSEVYADALQLYRRGSFDDAAMAFAALAENFDDPVSRFMAQRSLELAAAPPEDWRGVYRFDKK